MSCLGSSEDNLRFPPRPVQITPTARDCRAAWETHVTVARRPGLGLGGVHGAP